MIFLLPILACAPKNKVHRESFEHVWSTVNTTFPYTDFQGVDWQSVYTQYKPQAYKAQTAKELRPLLNKMLSELKVSHYGIIPQERYEIKVHKSKKTQDKEGKKSSSKFEY